MQAAPIPRTFLDYLRSMGPGLVVVLTWLGAGDIVDSAVAGGSYGYTLMWALALALVIRWIFVANIAKYQLCNQHGEGVMAGLHRLHPFFPPFVLVAALLLSHVIGIYMYLGLAESCQALAGGGPIWAWALGWGIAFFLLVSRPVFKQIERVFLAFLVLLSVSLITAAALAHPNWGALAAGTFGFRIPAQSGEWDPQLVATSLVGAVAGSLANLMYPYFIREKGWTTPAHRKVQLYDLALGVLVIIVLDLAVWVVGAEILHPRGLKVESTRDLSRLLTETMGPAGGVLIYIGIFAAVGSSIVGNALAYSYMATDAFLTWRPARAAGTDYRKHPGYRWMTLWCLFSPLPWVFGGQMSFVPLTLAVNAFQVLLLPVLAIAMWLLTSGERYIGRQYRNNAWENLGMGLFVGAALLGAWGSAQSLLQKLLGG